MTRDPVTMRLEDVAAHSRIDYFAKDFDEQQGYMLRLVVAKDRYVEVGVYLHWKDGSPVDVAVDVSCMTGCTEKCRFCAAQQIAGAPLTAAQAIEQVEVGMGFLESAHPDFMAAPELPMLTISFEGMGEPSQVPEEVTQAITRLREAPPLGLPIQFIVSTLLADPSALSQWTDLNLHTLQVSLHGATKERRRNLLIQSAEPSDLLQSVDNFATLSPDTQIKINYLLVADENDSTQDAHEVCDLLGSRPYFLKISSLNETGAATAQRLRRPTKDATDAFFRICASRRPPGLTYRYGTHSNVDISCGQLAAYANSTATLPTNTRDQVREIYERIQGGNTILFLGAGASYGLWDAQGLADQLYDELGFTREAGAHADLAETADFYASRNRRGDVKRTMKAAMDSARVPRALFPITQLPWKAIFTTNYDQFVEQAYQRALEAGATDFRCRPVIETKDLCEVDPPHQIPLVKLHGCITRSADNQVISGEDYLSGYLEDREYLFRFFEMEALRRDIVFIGYSFRDQYLGQLIATLKQASAGASTTAYAVLPRTERTDDQRAVLQRKFRINLVPATFDQFSSELSRLARQPTILVSGSSRPAVSGGVMSARGDVTSRLKALADHLGKELSKDGVRVVSGASARDKFGYMVGSAMDDRLVKTFIWNGAEQADDEGIRDEIGAMINVQRYGSSPSDVIARSVDLAHAAVFAGGSMFPLQEYDRAQSRGLLIIPIALGDDGYASDIIHSYLTGNLRVIAALAQDRGHAKKSGRIDLSARYLTQDRLESLRLNHVEPEEVAHTVVQIIRDFRLGALQAFAAPL